MAFSPLYGYGPKEVPPAQEGDGNTGTGQGVNPYADATLDDDNFTTVVSGPLALPSPPWSPPSK